MSELVHTLARYVTGAWLTLRGVVIDGLIAPVSGTWTTIRDVVIDPKPDQAHTDAIAAEARQAAPVLWLLGKVGAGKTSIVRTLTHATEAEVGSGFRACTRVSRVFDFPAATPVVRFLDTRGLGEVAYDPSEDIAFCESHAHLLLAVVRALDPVQKPILDAVSTVRGRHPRWPVIVAQTCLHEGYRPGANHVQPYPFANPPGAVSVPDDLVRALAAQRTLFATIPGRGPLLFVPVDFTLPDDGLTPDDYGLDALWQAIGEAAPLGLEAMLRHIQRDGEDAFADRAHPHIMGYAATAGGVDFVPAVGVVGVPVVQGKMLHSLAGIYAIDWTPQTLGEFAGCLGTGFLLRYGLKFGLRELVKLIPGYGQTVGAVSAAAISFATTFAIGKAACVYLAYKRRNVLFDPSIIAKAYADALAEAIGLARKRYRPVEQHDEASA
jgi:uncharacterized protein (DUF697 family)